MIAGQAALVAEEISATVIPMDHEARMIETLAIANG